MSYAQNRQAAMPLLWTTAQVAYVIGYCVGRTDQQVADHFNQVFPKAAHMTALHVQDIRQRFRDTHDLTLGVRENNDNGGNSDIPGQSLTAREMNQAIAGNEERQAPQPYQQRRDDNRNPQRHNPNPYQNPYQNDYQDWYQNQAQNRNLPAAGGPRNQGRPQEQGRRRSASPPGLRPMEAGQAMNFLGAFPHLRGTWYPGPHNDNPRFPCPIRGRHRHEADNGIFYESIEAVRTSFRSMWEAGLR